MQTLLGWHIGLGFRQEGSKTHAAAMLKLPDETELKAEGYADKHPHDPVQTRVGEELAAARALNELARQLLSRAADEIENATHVPVHPHL